MPERASQDTNDALGMRALPPLASPRLTLLIPSLMASAYERVPACRCRGAGPSNKLTRSSSACGLVVTMHSRLRPARERGDTKSGRA